MIAKNCGGRVPECGPLTNDDKTILAATSALLAECRPHHEVQAINRALDAIWKVIADSNRYFAAQEPWALRKSDPLRMNTVLYVTAEILRQIGILVQPYMPVSAAKLLDLLGIPAKERSFACLDKTGGLRSGILLPTPQPVFPRYVEAAEQTQPA